MNNMFLYLCKQAERNQSYELAKYLTWRSHQRETGYRATLFDDYYEGLQLIATSVEDPDKEEWFDLFEAGQRLKKDEERRQREQEEWEGEQRRNKERAENVEEWFASDQLLEDALNILCADYSYLYDKFGEDYRDVVDDAWNTAVSVQEGQWDDYDPQYPNNPYLVGRIVNGEKYATDYSGVNGRYWDSEWMYLGPVRYSSGNE